MAAQTTTKRATAKRATKAGSAGTKKAYPTKSVGRSTTPPSRRWSAKVDTDSTHPDEGLFLKSATEIARALASKRVAPKGPASGMRMLNFYINRAGKNLSAERQHVLEHAKELLSARIDREKSKDEAGSSGASAHKTNAERTRTSHRRTRRASSSRSH